MKLVEILARELVEWPEGAAIVVQDYNGEVKYQFSNEEPEIQGAAVWIRPLGGEPNDGIMFRAILAPDHTTAIVTREMWEAERAKLAPWFASEPACCHCIEMDVEFPTVSIGVGAACSPEWNGEGLPPVGTVCEAWHNGSAQGVVEVRYAGDCMVLWNVKRECEQCSVANNYSFRPIRTPEQIAAQDREQAITDLMQTTCIRRGEAARIYDAGYRRQ